MVEEFATMKIGLCFWEWITVYISCCNIVDAKLATNCLLKLLHINICPSETEDAVCAALLNLKPKKIKKSCWPNWPENTTFLKDV